MKLVTALQCFVVAALRALPIVFDQDAQGARRVLNHIIFPEYTHRNKN